MVLGIAEDFTSDVVLDSELTGTPLSGLYLNSGVHPSITIDNLLHFLPNDVTVTTAWSPTVTYGKFEDSRRKTDLVTKNDKIFQSIQSSNLNQDPETETLFWLETNIESLRLKNLIFNTLDKVYADLHLTKRLVNNQYLYEVGDNEVTLPNDFAAWVFEPKGSDYLTIRINQISFQKNSTTPVNLFVVNQGVLIDTLVITPSNGRVDFKELNYTFKGQGQWIFAIDSTTVKTKGYYVDPLKYDGFICHTAIGIGASAETADYSFSANGNGLGFNISAFLDANIYIDNNINELANYVRATFEYVVFQMYLHNSNNRSNRVQRLQMKDELLMIESKTTDADTVARRYFTEKKRAVKQLHKTFDTQLKDNNDFEIEITSF